jgi:hypothetical protein
MSHMRAAHSMCKPFPCPVPYCDKSFGFKRVLANHLLSVHGVAPAELASVLPPGPSSSTADAGAGAYATAVPGGSKAQQRRTRKRALSIVSQTEGDDSFGEGLDWIDGGAGSDGLHASVEDDHCYDENTDDAYSADIGSGRRRSRGGSLVLDGVAWNELLGVKPVEL